jgi:predicted XRE-type DNA-binding protein
LFAFDPATGAVLLVAGDKAGEEETLVCASRGARRASIRAVDQGGRVVTEWHIWDEVSAELGDALGSAEERAQRVEQLRRELVLRRLVEQRKRAGLRQVDVAERMGVSKARVSHIEHGAVATIDLLARYLDAIGGRLEITAAFDGGTERVVLNWPAA